MIETYVCQRCGKEKQVDLLPGQSIEDAKCSCKSGGSKHKTGLSVLGSNSGCGCGNSSCGCD